MAFPSSEGSILGKLMDTLPQTGTVTWLGVRPERQVPLQVIQEVEAITDKGLAGDRYKGKPGSKRQVTLIQAEHLLAVSNFMQIPPLDPGIIRRNIVVQGLNLLALKDKQFYVGNVLLEYTGPCHPCSRMEQNLGPGGYNAMRGHGGITARIIKGGIIKIGDLVKILPA